MPYPRARKTPQRRTSALQRKILDFINHHPKASFGDIRDALGITPRRSSKLYDSLRVLMDRGLIKRQRKIIVITGGFEYRLPTFKESLAHTWKAAYADHPGEFKELVEVNETVQDLTESSLEQAAEQVSQLLAAGEKITLQPTRVEPACCDACQLGTGDCDVNPLKKSDSPAPTPPQE